MISQIADQSTLLNDPAAIADLVRRMDLLPNLLRRQQEEAIISIVDLPSEWINEHRNEVIKDKSVEQFLEEKGWKDSDLDLHVARPEALRRFAAQRFGGGLEETFLSAEGGYDEIIYSFLRVSSPALAQELWIRLEEAETTFAEAASNFSEGPEAARKGVIGPLTISQVQPPQMAQVLRSLRPGQIHRPCQIGEWFVLLRLEQLTPARFDDQMEQMLLKQKLEDFLQERVRKLLAGEALEELHYYSEQKEQS